MNIRIANRSWLSQASKYLFIYRLSIKETLYYPKKLQTSAILVPFRILILLAIYTYAFHYIGQDINGVDAAIAVWSIAVYHLLLYMQFRGVFKTIDEEARKGTLELQINKPYSYVAYKFWEQFGKGLLSFLVSAAVVIPILLLFTHGFPSSASFPRLLYALLLAAAGTMVSAGLYILIALPSLWINDSRPFFWIVDKAILIFGGAYVPLALLPSSFQTFANFTPFGAPMFATQMFNPTFLSQWPLLLVAQLFWVIFFFILIKIVFQRAQRKLSINGG
jgi:ABC-2 type transport system permease protein